MTSFRLEHQVFHWKTIFQRDIESGFLAIAGSAAQDMEKSVPGFNTSISFHTFQLMSVHLNAEALEAAQHRRRQLPMRTCLAEECAGFLLLDNDAFRSILYEVKVSGYGCELEHEVYSFRILPYFCLIEYLFFIQELSTCGIERFEIGIGRLCAQQIRHTGNTVESASPAVQL